MSERGALKRKSYIITISLQYMWEAKDEVKYSNTLCAVGGVALLH